MTAPTTLRRIALMTQWTEFDFGAEQVAIELAQRLRLPLSVVVPLLSNPEYEVVAHGRVADAEAAAANAVAAFNARARDAGVTTEIRVRRGDELWREVVDEVHSTRADLLVTRRRGHRGFLGRQRVGEMVRQIAVHSSCPLLVVPRQARMPSKGILVVIQAGATVEPETRSAAMLASRLHLPLRILVVVPEGQARAVGDLPLQQAEEVARQAQVSVGGSVQTGPLPEALESSMRGNAVDLLVIGVLQGPASHGRLRDVVEGVVGGVPCATLLVGTQSPSA
jgi:nucleotide-binding universal stress UspA family protein